MTHLTVKNEFKKKEFKSFHFYGTRFSQPKYHIPGLITVTGTLKPKLYYCYMRKKSKMPIKSVKIRISKNKKTRFFLMSKGSLNPKGS